jgi:hypothetical protein
MIEKETTYELTVELPGMDENNVELKVAGGVLTIKKPAGICSKYTIEGRPAAAMWFVGVVGMATACCLSRSRVRRRLVTHC